MIEENSIARHVKFRLELGKSKQQRLEIEIKYIDIEVIHDNNYHHIQVDEELYSPLVDNSGSGYMRIAKGNQANLQCTDSA